MARGRTAAAVALLAVAGAVVTGCGSDDGGSDRPSAAGTSTATATTGATAAKSAVTVDIKNFKFVPATVAVKPGGKVTWVNHDSAPHTAENGTEAGPAKFETGKLDQGDRKTVTFTKPGTYRYYCVYHRFMEADVVVK